MPRECSTLTRAALLSFVTACAGTLYAAEPPASTAVDQRGAALRFEGKLGPDDPRYRKDFEAFRLRFGPGDWAGTTITATSAWGNGESVDLWGWTGGAAAEWSSIFHDDQGYYFILYVNTAGSSHRMIALFRYILKDGTPGVAAASFPYHGESRSGRGNRR